VLQCIWYDQLFAGENLLTDDGHRVEVVSPGWWNHGEGPDFKGAQIRFNGRLRSCDVEIHLSHTDWKAHGHHLDHRYDEVRLNVVYEADAPAVPIVNSLGHVVSSLMLRPHIEEDIHAIHDRIVIDDFPYQVEGSYGKCAAFCDAGHPEAVGKFVLLAGEWRVLAKARAMRERMERQGKDQALYEALLSACGFSKFKYHFQAIARQLPYERARQLGAEDGMLLETAFLQIAGLLPNELPTGTTAVPHFARLRALRRNRLEGLRSLPLEWNRVGVRPNNNPERRLAGAARFVARTAQHGLFDTLDDCWKEELKPIERRWRFEELFPSAMGFWASHCTWTGKKMTAPSATLGAGRVRSIIGNVFTPAALADARSRKDRSREERVYDFFEALPKEPENKIQKIMLPRLFGESKPPKLTFRLQQGLLQTHQDWCEPNPSCQNCRVMGYLHGAGRSGGE
jgi:hypothetical protein